MAEGDLAIREERPADFRAVEALVQDAFGAAEEAALVRRLRDEPGALSLVAEAGGEIAGHVLFTPVAVEGLVAASEGRLLGLAPMAVLPSRQRRGVGGALVRAGLAACAARGASVVFVLGHPTYYPRFGFLPAAPFGLHYGDGSHDAAFFLREAAPGALRAVAPGGGSALRGRVVFHRAFDGL